MQTVVELIFECLVRLIFWLVLLPVSMILATPFVLIGAVLVDRPYRSAVGDGYRGVHDFWKDTLVWVL